MICICSSIQRIDTPPSHELSCPLKDNQLAAIIIVRTASMIAFTEAMTEHRRQVLVSRFHVFCVPSIVFCCTQECNGTQKKQNADFRIPRLPRAVKRVMLYSIRPDIKQKTKDPGLKKVFRVPSNVLDNIVGLSHVFRVPSYM